MLFRRLAFAFALYLSFGLARADSDRWYKVEMLGKPAGHMHAVESTANDRITTTMSMTVGMKRGDVGLNIELSSEFVETLDGKPVSMKSSNKMGQTEVVSEYRFAEDGVEITTTQSGQTTRSRQPLPDGKWLPPAAADRYVTQRFKSGAKEIAVRSIDPSSGLKIVSSTRTIGEKHPLVIAGHEIDSVRTQTESSAAPGVKSVEYLDPEGVLVRSETQMGVISVVMTASTREQALDSGDGQAAPELFLQTFIKPKTPIAKPRSLVHAVYRLSVPDGQLPGFPATSSQAVRVDDPASATVTINTNNLSAAPPADAKNPAFTASTVMCTTTDEKLREIASRAVSDLGATATIQQKAEACRQFVYRYIKKKNLGVGFATATEVVRTREGDCSEHGVLLAALLRANGIPSRVASGVIYVDSFAGASGIFGYHMWAQALLPAGDGLAWVDLDATLPDAPFDAAHICLGISTLSDDEGWESMLGLAKVLGRLKIDVLETK